MAFAGLLETKLTAVSSGTPAFSTRRWTGLGAMVGAWDCCSRAWESGMRVAELPLMFEIGDYNEVDCRVMWEVVGCLRTRH
jgi:hypothetical protein